MMITKPAFGLRTVVSQMNNQFNTVAYVLVTKAVQKSGNIDLRNLNFVPKEEKWDVTAQPNVVFDPRF